MSTPAGNPRSVGLAVLVVLAAIGLLIFLGLLLTNPPWNTSPLPGEAARLGGLHGDALDEEKVRQEVIQLDLANATAASPWGIVLAFVPLASALLGGLAILATVWKQISERSDQLRQDREERERDHQRQFADSFKTTVENLAADKPSLRASAAATLSTFLRPEYAEFRDEVLLVALAKSKEGMEDDAAVARLIVRSVELALRARLPTMAAEDRRYFLDFSRCRLQRIDLSGLDLSSADIGFADLSDATLTGVNLFRARGYKVRLEGARIGASDQRPADLREARLRGAIAPGASFHRARCVSIRLEEADLREAEFYGAQLQEAHFDSAILTGAKFDKANLNNALFRGATFDDAALRSIATGADHWREAHFDPAVRARLDELGGPRPAGPAVAPGAP
jgi:uncharacterized protein YjbI with pentapeptide repeats